MKMFRSLLLVLTIFIFGALWGCSGENTNGANGVNLGKSTGKLAGANVKVSNATEDQQNPKVIYLQDKKLYLTVWEDWRNRLVTGSDIYGQFTKENGDKCGSDFIVNHATANQTVPTVAYKPRGKVLVAWQDTVGNSTGGYVNYTNFTPPSDTECGTYVGPGNLTETPVGFTSVKDYKIAIPINKRDIVQTTYSSYGWSSIQHFATAQKPIIPNNNINTSVKISSLNSATPDDFDTTSVFAFSLMDDGNGVLNPVGGSNNNYWWWNNRVNYNTGAITLYYDVPNGSGKTKRWYQIDYQVYGKADYHKEKLLSRKSPKVVYDAARDEFWLAWIESRDINNLFSTTCWGTPFTWLAGDSSFPGYLRLRANDLGKITNSIGIAEADLLRNGETTTARLLSSSMDESTINYTYEYFLSINNISIGSDSSSPETLFVWEGIRQKGVLGCTLNLETGIISSSFASSTVDDGLVHVYGLFDKEILLPSTNSRRIDLSNTSTGSNPNVAVDGVSSPRKFLVAWEDSRNGSNTKIFGQLINSGGGLYNVNFNITGSTDSAVTSSRQTAPSITYDALQQRYFVAWQDGRNSSTSYENLDIYGQYIDAEGSLRGDNYFVATDSSNQYAPSIAYSTGANQFFAVWKDARNTSVSGSDIYGQLYSQGQPHLAVLKTDGTILAPPLLNFGEVQMGSSKNMQFVVQNTGDAALNIDAITQINDPFKILPVNSVTLSPGASTTLTVTYSPLASGTNNSSVTIKSDGGNQLISLVGLGAGSDPLQIKTTSLYDGTPGQLYPTTKLSGYGGSYPYTWAETTGVLAGMGLSLNKDTGVISGTIDAAVTPKKYDITVTLTDQTGFKVTKPLNVNIGLISVKTTTLNGASTGTIFNQQLEYLGGTAPVIWSSTALPVGLTLSATGVISGIPTEDGSYTIDITVTDANGAKSTKPFVLQVQSPISILTSTIADMQTNVPVSISLQATGGKLPYSWTLTKGAYPTGINPIDANGGNISGTPTLVGDYSFEITVTDALGATTSLLYPVKVRDTAAPVATHSITTTSLPSAPLNISYSQTLHATGGRMPYAWSISGGGLPTGLTLGAVTGMITGIPTESGEFKFEVKLTDADGLSTIKVLSINAGSTTSTVSIMTSSLPTGELSKPYTATLIASGGTVPRTWELVGGTLPLGLSLASATGIISGTPTAEGNYDLIFQVTDMDKKTTTQTLSIVVIDPLKSGGLVQFIDGTTLLTTLSYGNVYKGTYNKKTVTLKNTSSSAVSISKVSSSSPAFTVSSAPFTIAPNSTTTLEISFIPARNVGYSGTITLTDSNGGTYILPVTGSGLNTNVEIKSGSGSVSYFNTLSNYSLPNINKPADFITKAAVDFQISGVTPNGTVTVAVTFATMPENPVFYKVVGNQWIPVNGATVAGNVVTFSLTDNSNMDSDPTSGVIRDPLVVGTAGVSGSGTNYAPPSSGGSTGGGGCFIATAAFGSYLDPHVMVLRHFRDNVLLQSEIGTEFVKFYYKYSPPVADFIAHHDALRMLFRFALTPLIFGAEYPMVLALLFAIATIWFIRRRLIIKMHNESVQQVI